MIVTNINGITPEPCSCGSWLYHWKTFCGQSYISFCPAAGCNNRVEAGAHVQIEVLGDHQWYIIPLCNDCYNKTGESMEIADYIKPVPADVNITCG